MNRRIPLWVGGQSEIVQQRTGRKADGWFPGNPWFSEEQLHEDCEIIRAAAKAAAEAFEDAV